MELRVRSDSGLIRLEFSGGSSWNAGTFLAQLDSMVLSMKQAFDAHPGPLLFDFSRLDHIDSSIVTLLVQGLRLAGPRGVSVVAADRNTLNLLDRMGFNSLASIFPSMQAFEESRTLLT